MVHQMQVVLTCFSSLLHKNFFLHNQVIELEVIFLVNVFSFCKSLIVFVAIKFYIILIYMVVWKFFNFLRFSVNINFLVFHCL